MSVQIESNADQYGEIVSFQRETKEEGQSASAVSRYSTESSSSHLAGVAAVDEDDAYVADWVI